MIETFEPVGAHDARLARGAALGSPLLEAFNEAGVVAAGDLHVATTVADLVGELDETVRLAVALTVGAVRAGSVCLDLRAVAEEGRALTAAADDADEGADEGDAEEPEGEEARLVGLPWPEPEAWAAAVAGSPLVAAGVVRWDHGLLYLDRYHQQETQVLDDLAARATTRPTVDADRVAASVTRVLDGPTYAEQRAAVTQVAGSWTTVLTGGPGTGKTTTVAGLLVVLAEQAAALGGRRPRVALAAPTGKAAARLQEAVRSLAGELDPDGSAGLAGATATTLHRLLRTDPGNRTRFRHHRGNRLPHDVVVVDEASMVSLTMMARLLEAVRPDARLVLVGDPDQLASVDAGAVLGDLVAGYAGHPSSPVARLATAHRYGAEIGRLAEALRRGDADAVLEALAAGGDAVVWVPEADPSAALRSAVLPHALALRSAAATGDLDVAVAALDAHRLLCAHREGPFGVRHWNAQVEQWLVDETGDPLRDRAYVGRPLLVTANDHALGVSNGDTGVVVRGPSGPRVALSTGGAVRDLAPSRLGDVETMHALTIHKSQGSQADEVTVLLPDERSRLLTRELFYTAVTRAQTRVRVVGDEAAVRAAVDRRARRASGLRQRLADRGPTA